MRREPGSAAGADRWFIFWAVCFLVAAPLAVFLPALRGALIYGGDAIAFGVPAHAEIMRSLAAHEWPLWTPDILGGMPGIAASNLLFLTPTDLPAYLAGWTLHTQLAVDAILWVSAAGIGMFFFLRALDRSLPASLLGAFFFAASGSLISQVYGGYYNFVEGIPLTPWIFWAAYKGFKESSWLAWGLCGLASALQILAQASQLFAYTFPAVAAFTLAMAWSGNSGTAAPASAGGRPAPITRTLQGLAVALGVVFLVSAPQLWPTLRYLPLTSRRGFGHAQFIAGSIPASAALVWLVPGFMGWHAPTFFGGVGGDFGWTTQYLGLLPWALAGGAIAARWRRDVRVRFMALLALAAFVAALRPWTPLQALFFHLPVFNRFQNWSRILFLVALAVCALAAFGWDALEAPTVRAAGLGIAVFFGLALPAVAYVWVFAGARAAAGAPPLAAAFGGPAAIPRLTALLTGVARHSARTTLTLIPADVALLWLAAKRRGSWWVLALALLLHAADQSQVAHAFVRFVDPGRATADLRFKQAPPPPAGVEPWRIYDYSAFHPNQDMVFGYENMCGLASMPLGSTMDIADAMGGRVMDWYDLYGARYIFVHSRIRDPAPTDQVTVYENRSAFPRAWLVTRVRKVSGDDAAYRLLADKAFNPRTEVALAADPGLSGIQPRGGVRWLERSPQTASLAVSSDRACVLVLSNAWYPSWRARVDGRDASVLKADGGLQAVALEPGRHTVDFRFDPGLFHDALAACLAGLALLLVLARHEARSKGQGGGGSGP